MKHAEKDSKCEEVIGRRMPRRIQSVKNHRKKDVEWSPSENRIKYK